MGQEPDHSPLDSRMPSVRCLPLVSPCCVLLALTLSLTEHSKCGITTCSPKETHSQDAMFDILAKYSAMKSVIGAGSENGEDVTDSADHAKNGICRGHACECVLSAPAESHQ